MTQEAFLTLLSVQLKKDFTEEQLELAKSFTDNVICFADPGTGKTATAVAGLLNAELFHKIPGKNIYALSFTNKATAELSVRHNTACNQVGISQKVNFATLHKLCTQILEENYTYFGFDDISIGNTFSIEELKELLLGSAEERGIKLSPYKVYAVVKAVRSLNSSLVFDRKHVESKMCFKKTGLTYEDFTELRAVMYQYNKCIEQIQIDDVMLYTLELLIKHPEVSERFKEKCKLMLIDEAQDLSLLQLELVSRLTRKAVLIGDMKQQIYAFNGACQEIIAQYLKLYPDAKQLKLTKSWRCYNAIADYATPIILPNGVGGDDYKGVREGGIVETTDQFDIKTLADQIYENFINNNRTFPKSIMFLFRNNYSAIPIAEELYRNRIPFKCKDYKGAHKTPVISDLCEIIEFCINPCEYSNAQALTYLIPEFRGYRNPKEIPLAKIAAKLSCSMLEVNYNFKYEGVGQRAMQMLMEVREMYLKNAKVGDMFNTVYRMYYEQYLHAKEPYMESKPSYYTSLVAPLVKNKTYNQFCVDEREKVEFIKDNIARDRGICCYTIHAAKGLEADIVHLVQADDDILPSNKKIEEMLKFDCKIDAAREIRNERALAYVAVTRAKSELYIHHDPGNLTKIISDPTYYADFDKSYEDYKELYNDIEEFIAFTEVA